MGGDDVLHTGDLILLKFRKEDDREFCFMSCDGITEINASIVATFDVSAIPDIRDCLFRVTYKLSYNAKKDFDKKRKEGASQEVLASLQDNVDKEESQNEEKLEMRCPLTYGESIQLLHVKSGKFLTILPKTTAAFDKQSRKVVVKEGSIHSSFRLAPFYMHRFMGESVIYNEQFVLQSFKLARWNLFAFTSQYLEPVVGQPEKIQFHELNCSTNMNGFFPVMYSRNPMTLNYASTVRFYHSQTACFMCVSCGEGKRPFFKRLDVSNYENIDNLYSKGAWVLEPADRLQGGACTWGALFGLKHIGSGKYLSVERSTDGPNYSRLKEIPDATCFFALDPIEAVDGKEIRLDATAKVKCLVKFEDEVGELWLTGNSKTFKEKPPGGPPISNPSLKLYWTASRRIREACSVECLNQSFPEFVEMVNSVAGRKKYILNAVEQVRLNPKTTESPNTRAVGNDLNAVVEAEKRERQMLELFDKINDVLSSSVFFLTGEEDVEDALMCSSKALADRQRIVKDLKYIDATVRLKEALWECGYRVDKMTSRTVVDLGIKGQILADPPPLTPQQLRSLCLLIEHWRCCFQDNRMIENYFDKMDWVEMINELNGRGIGAPKALGALVSANPDLILKMDPKVIEQFVNFIGQLGPDEMWPNFMKTVSSCEDVAIPAKQALILRMMYFTGEKACAEDREKWGQNREDLLVCVKMADQSSGPFPMSSNRLPEMLAKDLILGGVRDIVVSWNTDEQLWFMGADWLYFHPKHLGLECRADVEKYTIGKCLPKLWVKLASIAWVLNPERTYHVVHNLADDAWEKDGEEIKQTGRYKALMVLSRYIMAQIDMFSEICMDRQINSILALEKEYHFNLMVCGMYHHALAPPLRRAFVSLLINLWLDRHPQYFIKMPNVIFKFDGREMDTTGLPQYELLDPHPNAGETWEYYTMKEPTRFFLLFTYGRHHLSMMKGRMVHSHEGHNAYTMEVMNMMGYLAQFAFFYSVDLMQEFMTSMLSVMDGRTDWLVAPMVNLEKAAAENAADGGDNGIESYSPAQPLLSNGEKERENSRGWSCCGNKDYAYTALQAGRSESGRPLYLDIQDPADGVKRYPSSDRNNKVHETKEKMLVLCNRINQFSLNAALQRTVQIFKKEQSAGTLSQGVSEHIIAEVIGAIKNAEYDIDGLLGANTNTMLLDLLMYQNSDVFTQAMKMLRVWNHRVQITLDQAKFVRLLVDPDEFTKYERLKTSSFRLANLLQTHEFWGVDDCFSEIDLDAVNECKDLLKRLREICSVGGEGNDSENPDAGMQDTLASFNLGTQLCNAFDIPLSELHGKAREHVIAIMTLTTQLCVQYVNRHPANQNELFKQLDRMINWFSYGIGVANVVGGIFTGNRRLCENLPPTLLYAFAKVLQENKTYMPHQLAFFQSTVVVGQRPITKNKIVVLDILKSPQYNKVLHLMQSPEEKKRRRELIKNFKSWGELTKPQMFRKWIGGDGEIQYHNRSMELLAMMCVGRDASGSTAYVQAQVPAIELAAEFLDVDDVQQKYSKGLPNSDDIVAMCRVLKCTLLLLLENCYYSSVLQDEAFQVSSIHARLIKTWHASLLRLEPAVNAGNLGKLDCEFLIRLLKTIIAYCEEKHLRNIESLDISNLINQDIKHVLQRLHSGKGSLPTKNAVYKAAVARALGFIIDDMKLKSTRLMEDPNKPDGNVKEEPGVVINAQFQDFITAIQDHEIIKSEIQADHENLISMCAQIGMHTDVTDMKYKNALSHAQADGHPINGFDYRRNQVSLDEVVHRAVTHCLVPEHLKDWETTEFALTVLNDVLIRTQSQEKELDRLQRKFADSGAVQLVVDILMAKPDSTVIQLAIVLGCKLLEPNNKAVQEEFVEYFYCIDDSELWKVFVQLYDQLASNVKYVRSLKQHKRDALDMPFSQATPDSILTTAENNMLQIFSVDISTCISCMRFQQVFCEGHNFKMQQYIFQQVDNTSSFNFVEKTVDLFTKMCKNEKTANQMDKDEADLTQMSLDLLVEVTTGPCARNQEFLSVSGLIETAQKVLKAPCLILRSELQEPYPPEVRCLKSKLMALIQSILEVRQDEVVHRNVLFRTDTQTIKERLMFVHRWFLSERLQFHPEASRVTKQKNWHCTIDDLEIDDGIEVPKGDNMVMLDAAELVEEDLSDFFNEAFSITMLRRTLADINQDFKDDTEPAITPFKDDRTLYVNEEQYMKAKHKNMMEMKYVAAYDFFNVWINCIEIVLDGKIFEFFFRMPMLCNFVLGRAKLDIVNKVSIESPEDKAKDFCGMTMDTYDQTLHTRELSKFGIRLPGMKPIRPFNFFLKNDSKNLMDISKYGLALACVLNFCLFFALSLSDHKDTDALPFMFLDWQVHIDIMGYLYTVMMLTATVVMIIVYSPLETKHLVQLMGPDASPKVPQTLIGLLAIAGTIGGIIYAGLPVAFAIVVGCIVALQVGGKWAGKDCPNNSIGRLLGTASKSMGKQPVSRRVILVACSLGGNLDVYYWYSFLMLDLLFLSPMLQNVIKAVTVPLNALILVTILGLIVMYEYAIIAFYFFRKDYDGSCNSMLDCTTTTIYQGLRMDIGSAITETDVSMDNRWYMRMGFDLSYFVVITTILMNVIFGIILDTFGSLRDETQEREIYMKNNTFIACIDRGAIDKAAQAQEIDNGFAYLENEKHARWNYLNFIFYLKRKPSTEFCGPETKIDALLDDEDVSWMPLGVCRLMEGEGEEDDDDIKKVQAQVDAIVETLKDVTQSLASIQEVVELEAGGPEEISRKKSKAKLDRSNTGAV